LVGVTTLSLTAVGSTRRKTSITLTTDHLITVVLGSQSLKRGLNNTTTKTENQVKSRFLLDVVIAQRTTILELLTSENKTLLVRRDTYITAILMGLGLSIFRSYIYFTFLVLDLLLDIVNGVRAIYKRIQKK
jgi:hypothetical protein